MEFLKFWIILDILFYLWALNKILYSQVAPENRVFKLILWGVFEVFSILVDWLWGRRYSMIFSDFMGRQFCPPSELCPEFSKVWCITSDVLTFDSRTLGTIVSVWHCQKAAQLLNTYFLGQAWMSKNWNWRNSELVTFSEMKTLDEHKVDFKMIKDARTSEPKKKSKTCSSLICLLNWCFHFW